MRLLDNPFIYQPLILVRLGIYPDLENCIKHNTCNFFWGHLVASQPYYTLPTSTLHIYFNLWLIYLPVTDRTARPRRYLAGPPSQAGCSLTTGGRRCCCRFLGSLAARFAGRPPRWREARGWPGGRKAEEPFSSLFSYRVVSTYSGLCHRELSRYKTLSRGRQTERGPLISSRRPAVVLQTRDQKPLSQETTISNSHKLSLSHSSEFNITVDWRH